MEKKFKNSYRHLKKTSKFLYLISLFFMVYSLSFCKKWGCLDCEPWFKIPPLHLTAEEGNIEELKRLLDTGLDVNSRDDRGNTALHYASSDDREDVVLFLINKNSDVKIKNYLGDTPLHYVSSVGVAKILLDNGADITAENALYETPLTRVASKQVALFLIGKGGAKGREDEMLISAVLSGTKDIAKSLFQNGANPYSVDVWGHSAFSIAKERNYQELIELFKSYASSEEEQNP